MKTWELIIICTYSSSELSRLAYGRYHQPEAYSEEVGRSHHYFQQLIHCKRASSVNTVP